jgi:hypothetical protein
MSPGPREPRPGDAPKGVKIVREGMDDIDLIPRYAGRDLAGIYQWLLYAAPGSEGILFPAGQQVRIHHGTLPAYTQTSLEIRYDDDGNVMLAVDPGEEVDYE